MDMRIHTLILIDDMGNKRKCKVDIDEVLNQAAGCEDGQIENMKIHIKGNFKE